MRAPALSVLLAATTSLLLGLPAKSRATTPDVPALATRLAEDTSLDDAHVLRMHADSWRANLECKGELRDLRSALARFYAEHLSADQMQAAAAFLETPLGRPFERKALLAAPNNPANVTPEEMDAARTFAATPAGQAFIALQGSEAAAIEPFALRYGQKLWSWAQAIHCRDTGRCGPPS